MKNAKSIPERASDVIGVAGKPWFLSVPPSSQRTWWDTQMLFFFSLFPPTSGPKRAIFAYTLTPRSWRVLQLNGWFGSSSSISSGGYLAVNLHAKLQIAARFMWRWLFCRWIPSVLVPTAVNEGVPTLKIIFMGFSRFRCGGEQLRSWREVTRFPWGKKNLKLERDTVMFWRLLVVLHQVPTGWESLRKTQRSCFEVWKVWELRTRNINVGDVK